MCVIMIGHAHAEKQINKRHILIEEYMANKSIRPMGKPNEATKLHDLSITVTAGARDLSMHEFSKACEWFKRYCVLWQRMSMVI